MRQEEHVTFISHHAAILFAKAAEIFIQELTVRSWLETEEEKKRTLTSRQIVKATAKCEQYDFLIDIIAPYKRAKLSKKVRVDEDESDTSDVDSNCGESCTNCASTVENCARQVLCGFQPPSELQAAWRGTDHFEDLNQSNMVPIVVAGSSEPIRTDQLEPVDAALPLFLQVVTSAGNIMYIPYLKAI
uniref:Nuclear transcription factor Y subunit gamma n=1 Tax=Anopheles epiroticus TaxID=199890 RepID=A0A182PYS6_9DIPT